MLILASASPRRRELLTQAGLEFTVESPNIPELPEAGEDAATFVLRLAEAKAQAVWSRHSELQSKERGSATELADAGALDNLGDLDDPLIILGADTCVLCQGEILGKPQDQAEARSMLELLSGRTHQVLTGVAVITAHESFADVVITQVTFNRIEETELVHYLSTGEPLDKAGAYGIQGYAARWIPRIEGDYFNIVGLPIARTISLLAEARAAAGRSLGRGV